MTMPGVSRWSWGGSGHQLATSSTCCSFCSVLFSPGRALHLLSNSIARRPDVRPTRNRREVPLRPHLIAEDRGSTDRERREPGHDGQRSHHPRAHLPLS